MASGAAMVKQALEQFKLSVSSDDARTFSETTYQQLWEGAVKIEEEQGRRLDLRFMKRIEPFLNTMESYGPIIEVLTQGFSPMAFVWGPIKMMLLLAKHYTSVMDQILQAYADIADVLPRMDRLKAAFGDTQEFQQILGLIYRDIIEFHERAYRMFRRKAWQFWFACDWGLFQRRFKSILSRLASHCDLLDKEAASIHFLQMKAMRERFILEEEALEQQREMQMARDVFEWLSAAEDTQEEYLHKLSDRRQPGTCNFVFNDPRVSSWADGDFGPDFIWMTGIPGAGKSVLCSLVIESLLTRPEKSSLYYFCGDKSPERDSCGLILRSIAHQLLQQNKDLCPLIHQAYITKGSSKSSATMKKILKEVLPTAKATRIVLDGVDECEDVVQRDILSSLTDIQKHVGAHCKILVSSRNQGSIKQALAKKEHFPIDGKNSEGLNLYIESTVSELKKSLPYTDNMMWIKVERTLKRKAQGMFLWVRLVACTLLIQMSQSELEDALEKLPDGLGEAYGRIIARIRTLSKTENERAFRILYWVCLAYRPVSIFEVADGITLKPNQTSLNNRTRPQNLERSIIDVCAPLLERSSKGNLDLVHFSAKEYLLHKQSGPFVKSLQAHFNIAFSCIVNLNTALELVPWYSNHMKVTDLEKMVVQGACGLQSYAHQYWLEHTMAYLNGIPEFDDQALILIRTLDTFSRACKYQEAYSQEHMHSKMGRSFDKTSLLIFQNLDKFTRVQALLSKWLCFRTRLKNKMRTLDDFQAQEQWRLAEDETFLSLIEVRLRGFHEHLLRMDRSALPNHIEKIDHEAFVARFGFSCRITDCNHAFDREPDRENHERNHTVLFPCDQCDFSGKGFRTRKMLEHHKRTYHTCPEDFEIPASLEAASTLAKKYVTRPCALGTSVEQWNECGRNAVQKTLRKMLAHVESEMTLGPVIEDLDINHHSSKPMDNAKLSSGITDLKDIRTKIEAQQYQSMGEFKNNVHQVLAKPSTLTISDSFEDIEALWDREIVNAASSFPDFANPAQVLARQSSAPACMTTFDNEEDIGESGPAGRDALTRTYWSQTENAEFRNLIAKHGRDTHKISDFLMTKTPQDVEDRFKELTDSGREDLILLADAADASQRQGDQLVMLDSESDTSSLPESGSNHDVDIPNTSSESSAAQPKEAPAPHIVRPEEYLNYKPHIQPPTNATSDTHSHSIKSNDAAVRPKYKRAPPQKQRCYHCNYEFRDNSTCLKHIKRFHDETRTMWICEDVSSDKNFFGSCKSCSKKKRYSTKPNAFKHLRMKHFSLDTPKETLVKWLKETEERNKYSDNKQTEWLRARDAQFRERPPEPWQANKRQRTDNGPGSSWLRTPDSHFTIPPMGENPETGSGSLWPGMLDGSFTMPPMGGNPEPEPLWPRRLDGQFPLPPMRNNLEPESLWTHDAELTLPPLRDNAEPESMWPMTSDSEFTLPSFRDHP